MTDNTKYTRKAACRILAQGHPGFDRNTESDHASNGGFRPNEFAGQHLYGTNELVALDYQLCLRREGWPVKLAGALAQRLYEALSMHPSADRIGLVTLDNGNRFAIPDVLITDYLLNGYSSGALVREVLAIDTRNLRLRVERMAQSAGLIVGEADEE